MMRRIIGLIVLVLFPSWTLTAIAQSDVKERTDAARAVAADFGLTLIAELQKAIAAGGPVNAIGVCHLAAPKIAAEKSAVKKMSIGRTSLRLRQPKRYGRQEGVPLYEGDSDCRSLPELSWHHSYAGSIGEAEGALSRGCCDGL